jgi:aspartate/tyrosine/aromatic aminotransferase
MMLETLAPQPADSILRLMQLYKDDPRTSKIDLGVGVYKDATGLTPIMRAVKAAERRLLDSEVTKTYTALAGEAAFNAAISRMILGDVVPMDKVASAASVGGTGAIRQGMELIRLANPDATIWVSDPTWPNHLSIINYLGIPSAKYRYFDAETRGIDFAGLMADLGTVKPGDIVLLHGCCHNPTGANLNTVEWTQVADLLIARGAIPFIDLAYQGFGDGLEEDAAATRMIAARFPQVLIAASCSKNFGIYRERTGILIVLCAAEQRATVQDNLAHLNRVNFSFPPDHGARIVTTILQDAGLTADWKAELEEVRLSMLSLRQALADALRGATGSDQFGFVAQHRGMFSRLGLTGDQVERLRLEHGIYVVGDSRINIAGLNAATVPILAAAIAAVTG